MSETWFAFSGPARLPGNIVGRLRREIEKILQGAEVRKRMAQDEIEIKLMTPEAVTNRTSRVKSRGGVRSRSRSI